MTDKVRALALGILGVTMMTGCATKGALRKGLENERLARTEAIGQERMERIAADSATMREIASLRTDLQALRTEFGAKIAVLDGQVKFAFPVHFGFDDATVRDADRAALDRFADVVAKHYTNSEITIEGFADPAGTVAYNNRLSGHRANNVRDYLVTKGLSGSTLRTVGYGKSRLVRPGATRDEPGAELNRRVVFVVETPSEATTTAMAVSGN